jgi:hypothetical protein
MERIKLAGYRATKWALLGGVMLWLPSGLVLFEVVTGVPALALVELRWLAANLGFGVMVLVIGQAWSKRYVERRELGPRVGGSSTRCRDSRCARSRGSWRSSRGSSATSHESKPARSVILGAWRCCRLTCSPAARSCRSSLRPRRSRGAIVTLRPLALATDLEELFAISSGAPAAVGPRRVDAYHPDARVWRYMSGGPFADTRALGAWLERQIDAPDGLSLAVRDRGTGALVGVANFMANQPAHLKIELGNIWYGPVAQGREAPRRSRA